MTARGVLDHNPFDLKDFGIKWQGLDKPAKDEHGFCRFTSDFYGLRAGFRDLHTKWSKHGLRTVSAIVSVYAPPTTTQRLLDGSVVHRQENDTKQYIEHVSKALGVKDDEPLNLDELANLVNFGRAIIIEEVGGMHYADDLITRAARAALEPEGATPMPTPRPNVPISVSTAAGAGGGMAVTLIDWIVNGFPHPVPLGVSAALAGLAVPFVHLIYKGLAKRWGITDAPPLPDEGSDSGA